VVVDELDEDDELDGAGVVVADVDGVGVVVAVLGAGDGFVGDFDLATDELVFALAVGLVLL
jgi:hypothetical protein